MTTETAKGFKDFVGEEEIKRTEIKRILIDTFEKYGFETVETPIIEYEKFVKGENPNDEAISDIFKLKDKGKRNLALRYEFTFQLKRIAKNKKLPYKRYQIGEVFRDEPVSSNRLRQFTQIDMDVVGSTVKDEAEILAVTNDVLKELGITSKILINNRKLLNEILNDLNIKQKDRKNVLKEIDKYDKLPEKEVIKNLNKFGAGKVLSYLKKGEKYFEKFESYKEILFLIKYCKLYGVKVLFSPTIVRGLSYYNGSVFEIKSEGIKETICGGGSYMVDNVQSTGISFGLERLSALAKIESKKETILIWSNNNDREAIKIAEKLRKKGEFCTLILKNNMNKVFEYSNSKKFDKTIFYDKKIKKFKIKDMETGKEKLFKLS